MLADIDYGPGGGGERDKTGRGPRGGLPVDADAVGAYTQVEIDKKKTHEQLMEKKLFQTPHCVQKLLKSLNDYHCAG